MARAMDGARSEVFNLGEVLVTEARVSIAGHEGWGMVLGRAPDHAIAVAVVDAGLEAGHAERAAVERDLADAAAEQPRRRRGVGQVAPTRVQFETSDARSSATRPRVEPEGALDVATDISRLRTISQ